MPWQASYRAPRSHRARPPGAGGGNVYLNTQNNYYEMYFNQRRCLLKANQQLLPKGDPKFAKFYDDAGKSFADLEMINGNRFNDDVREKYHDLPDGNTPR